MVVVCRPMVVGPLKGSRNSGPFCPTVVADPFTVQVEPTVFGLVSMARARIPKQVVSVVTVNSAGGVVRMLIGCMVSIVHPFKERSTVICPMPGSPHAMVTQLLSEPESCLLYTSDAADERSSVDLGGRRIIKKKKKVIILMSTDSGKRKNRE